MQPHYYSLNEYYKQIYNEKIYKLALSGGMTCPVRDGLIDTRGCIFCSLGGSGDFASAFSSIRSQIASAKALVSNKYNGSHYIGYFQSFTNTYADVDYLDKLFTEAINCDELVGLSIGTRPDCLSEEIIALLERLNKKKRIWVELGLQTIHNSTATYIRRGYTTDIYDDAVQKLTAAGLEIVTHIIIGLPGESTQMILDTVKHVADSPVKGIKLQLLHVLKDTDLAKDYEAGKFDTLSMEEYFAILGKILPILPKDMVVHRITGDGPKKLLIAPLWTSNKHYVLNSLNSYLENNNIYQGTDY